MTKSLITKCGVSTQSNVFPVSCPGEKRKLPESLTIEDAKRIRVLGDIPMELVNEVMLTITDPAAMLGPEVRKEAEGELNWVLPTSEMA